MIGVIDYGMGNVRSVQKAFEHVGAPVTLLSDPSATLSVDRLVLPGVGAYAQGMRHLADRGWIEPIRRYIATGRPFIGICLGMQLLFEGSQEDAPNPDQPIPGLAVLPGQVVRLIPRPADHTPRLKITHMGWNTLRWQRDDPLLTGLPQNPAVYFVHGYYPVPTESTAKPITSARCDYSGPFCASVWCGNIWATQFHPEKSQDVGLKMLANFASACNGSPP
jgi:glutamine amidotransferase